MTKEEKFEVIMERCDKYWETKDICFGCPIWKYIRQNDIDFCDERSTDKQYEILMESIINE